MSKENEKESEKDGGLGEVIKRVVSIGVGAAFMTEDTVKNIISDLPLPKQIVTGLLQNAKNAKEEFLSNVRDELKSQFSKMDPAKLVSEVLENYDIEVNAKLNFKRKKDSETKDGQ
ncbi:MAG: hypothetical protein OEY33_01245 [Bdellovibrionales bacterium]|nr:hypothetical protein [Bdellovibrionales bacterium]